jgi:hypothetical protein
MRERLEELLREVQHIEQAENDDFKDTTRVAIFRQILSTRSPTLNRQSLHLLDWKESRWEHFNRYELKHETQWRIAGTCIVGP